MPTVLVVDDDPAIRMLVRDVLEDAGFTIREAVDGLDALAAIERRRPDAVVLDVMMPRLDGHQVLTRIRTSAIGTGLPVVMLTAAADDTRAWQAYTQGVDYFLAKPFDPDELLRFFGYLFGDVAPCPEVATSV